MAEALYILMLTLPSTGTIVLRNLPEISVVFGLLYTIFCWLRNDEIKKLKTIVLLSLSLFTILRGDYWIGYFHSRLLCVTETRVQLFETVYLNSLPMDESNYSREYRWRTGQYYEIEGARYRYEVERHGLENKLMSQLYRVNFVSEQINNPLARVDTYAPNPGWFNKVFSYADPTGPWFCEGRALRGYGRGKHGEPDLAKLVFIEK